MNTKDPSVSERFKGTKDPLVLAEDQIVFFFNDLALAAASAGDHEKAVEYFKKAVSVSAKHAFILSNYALSLRDIGQFGDAINILKEAIFLDEYNSVFLFNLGNIQYEVGFVRHAMASYEKALRGHSCFPELLCNYALVALGEQEIALAQRLARRGLSECPTDHPLKVRFAVVLSNIDSILGQTREALARLEDFITAPYREEALCEYIRILKTAMPEDLSTESLRHIYEILKNKWSAPEHIVVSAWRCIVKDHGFPQAPISNPLPELTLLLLSSTIVPAIEMEAWLIEQRRYLLELDDDATLSQHDITFFSALAQQCFHRNYLFQDDPDSLSDIGVLRSKIESCLNDGKHPHVLWILQYACREPLVVLKHSTRLMPIAVALSSLTTLFVQQIQNLMHEEVIEATIPRVLDVSVAKDKVAEHYSNYPYPQWTWPGTMHRPELFNIYLKRRLSNKNFDSVSHTGALHILVAGCGTGRHSHALACMLSNCVIKAIDVSRRSLAVAKRHALESKLSNIEYIDGDIMYLEHWSDRFEVIECAGVLHHLPDPEAGLKILLNLLKPNGMILLGLYSRRARKPLMALRARVEPFTKNGMVAALHRARTIAKTDQTFHSILNLQDFFSLNGGLDLILHPRETSYGPLEISSLLQRHGLLFRGFELSDVQKSTFQMRNRHPDDILDLSKWEQYEIEYPDTFVGMYQLWAQKTIQ